MKQCSKCKKEKPFGEFNKKKLNKDGLQYWCKDCVKEYDKEYRKNNKELIAEQRKEYRENNKEIIAEQRKKHYENNKESIAEKNKKYYEDNKEKILKNHKEYRKNNKEQIAENKREYQKNNKEQIAENKREYQKNNKEQIAEYKKNKYHTDINHKLSVSLRNRIGIAVKANQKQGSAVRDLGCSIQFLKEYMEQQFKPDMSWDNYGEIWHIDHIIPLNAFDLTDQLQFRAACYYENLQPLFVEENLRKGNKYKQEDYEKYLEYFKTKIKMY